MPRQRFLPESLELSQPHQEKAAELVPEPGVPAVAEALQLDISEPAEEEPVQAAVIAVLF